MGYSEYVATYTKLLDTPRSHHNRVDVVTNIQTVRYSAQVFPAGAQSIGSLGQQRTPPAVVPFPPHTTALGAHGGRTGAANELRQRGECEGVMQGMPCSVSINAEDTRGKGGFLFQGAFPPRFFFVVSPFWGSTYNESVLFRGCNNKIPLGMFLIFFGDPCLLAQGDSASLYAEEPLVQASLMGLQ